MEKMVGTARLSGVFGIAIAIGAMVIGIAVAPVAAMVGGAPSAGSGAGRAVVMILGSYGTVCTATAVARDLLLTAAHCVQPGADYKLMASKPGEKPVLKDFAHIERDPQFELKRLFAHLATADVALLKLAEPLPDTIATVVIAADSETVAAGDTLTVAGYGVTAHGAERLDGVLRSATLTVTGQPGTLQIRLFDAATKGARAGLGACTGDSGAPAFRDKDGNPAIVGVVSWSTGPNLTGGCGGLTGITPLMRYRAWIVDTARKLGSRLP
ncbi:MAG TPA: S1 family peptidase [Xanthobacteraceae bacterium]|jgi:secreted trypsin-like serine protease|nr:S1 family peptidase [Xanthobacteraceae bacterium]